MKKRSKVIQKLSFLLITLFLSISSQGEISKDEFLEVSDALIKSYSEFSISINSKMAGEDFWWNLDEKYGSFSKYTDAQGKTNYNIFFFGGLARMPEMTPEGAALILCHELGHGIGGAPTKLNSESSVEGQADYFATRVCLPKVLYKMPIKTIAPSDPLNLCKTENCKRIYVGIISELAVIQFNHPNQEASFEKSDTTIVDTINTNPTFYPSNQCRLDTMVAGALEKERPRCWWSPHL